MNAVMVPPRRQESETRRLRGRRVSHIEARSAAERLIHSHFGQYPHARITIPVQIDDDDVLIMDYIEQQQLIEMGLLPVLPEDKEVEAT